jgi:hypothetical protein
MAEFQDFKSATGGEQVRLSREDIRQIVDAIDEVIENKLNDTHRCRFKDEQFVALIKYADWLEENQHTLQSIAEFWDNSKKWWIGTIWAGVVGMLIWTAYLIFFHGWRPGK